jgi:hypothetical protein
MKGSQDTTHLAEEPKDAYNLDEHSPVWQHLKKERDEKLKLKKKKEDTDYTRW